MSNKVIQFNAIEVDLIASVPVAIDGTQTIIDGSTVVAGDLIYPSANALTQVAIWKVVNPAQPWVLDSSLFSGISSNTINIYAKRGSTYGGKCVTVNNPSTSGLVALPNQTIIIDSACDVTITPTGVQDLNGFTTGDGNLVLLMVDPNAGYYKTSSTGAWELLCLFANIPDGTVFRCNNVGSLWTPQTLTIATVEGAKTALQSAPSTKENVIIMGTNGSDLLPRSSYTEPFASISAGQLYMAGLTNYKNITIYEAPTSGAFQETIGSIGASALLDNTSITSIGFAPIESLLLDSDVSIGINITFTNLNLGTRFSPAQAILCRGTNAVNISGITFVGTGISSTLGRKLTTPAVPALVIDNACSTPWGMNFINYYIDGDVTVGGNYQVDVYNMLQYNNATVLNMVGSDVNPTGTGNSYWTYHNTDFEYFGHTVNISSGALTFKSCTATQTVIINVNMPAVPTVNDGVQIYFENCSGDFQIVLTRVVVGTTYCVMQYDNSTFLNQDMTQLSIFNSGTSPRADSNIDIVPTNGATYALLDAFKSVVNLVPASDIAQYSLQMPPTNAVGLVNGYTINFKNQTNFLIGKIILLPSSGQTINTSMQAFMPNSEFNATWSAKNTTWIINSIASASRSFLEGYLTLGSSKNFGGTVTPVLSGLAIAEGNPGATRMGVAEIFADGPTPGSTTISCPSVTANTRIFCFPQVPPSGAGLTGALKVSAVTPGVSFTISDTVTTEIVTFAYLLIEAV